MAKVSISPRIGVNTQPSILMGSSKKLSELLDIYWAAGANHAELSPHGLDVIYNLRLRDSQLRQIQKICEAKQMTYSVHAPNCLNFMDIEHLELHKAMSKVLLDFCAAVGAGVLVIHGGRTHKAVAREQLRDLLVQEREWLAWLGDIASALGVQVAVENLNPERAFIEGRLSSYALDPAALAEQIEAVGHSNISATLDFGHAICASNWIGFDLLRSITTLAPLVTHFHVTDAFGRPPTMPDLSWEYQAMYGMNDVDIPLGEGEVPFDEIFGSIAFPRFKPGKDAFVIETKPRFIPIIAQFIRAAKEYAETFSSLGQRVSSVSPHLS